MVKMHLIFNLTSQKITMSDEFIFYFSFSFSQIRDSFESSTRPYSRNKIHVEVKVTFRG